MFFILLNAFYVKMTARLSNDILISFALIFTLGVMVSHVYRHIIVHFNWLRMSTLRLIPSVLLTTIALASALHFMQIGIESLMQLDFMYTRQTIFQNILNFSFVLFFWSLIYFLVHYVENYKKAEIENLKWEASIKDIELNKLKSQLNPHFIFNSMNSIRALVNENPEKAKDAITQLSNILRNTLLMSKKKVISFGEEFNIVKDYLGLEATRFEERLRIRLDIAPESEDFELPPLMVQTLIENGIKHGISRLTQGGEISLTTFLNGGGKLHIVIRNSGQLNGQVNESGFGIKNTIQRLELLYGKEASFEMQNEDANTVRTEIVIPKTKIV